MITIKLMGGLGNQMFQYAFIRAQAERTKQEFALETGLYSKHRLKKLAKNILKIIFSLRKHTGLSLAIKEIKQNRRQYDLKYFQFDAKIKKIKSSYLPEIREKKEFCFDPGIVSNQNDVSFIGYFNTEKYFFDIAQIIRDDFKLKPEYLKNIPQNIKDEINSSNSVSIHIRRGDYISSKVANNFHGSCHLDYYEKAIDKIKQTVTSPRFFIFSDDIEWCQSNLELPAQSVFISGLKNYEDLTLMSQCKHHIIANSTFSWWGAWLGKNKEKIIIAPKKWLKADITTSDILPSSWLKI